MAKSSEKDAPVNRHIGFSLLRERRRQGLTVPQLARRAAIHTNTLDRAEKGFGITASTLVRLAKALDVSLDKLALNSQYVVGFSAEVKKAAKVVCGTENLFSSSNPSSARPASTTTVGSGKRAERRN